jgi:hypothetical protein
MQSMGSRSRTIVVHVNQRKLINGLPLITFLIGVLFVVFHFDLKPVAGDEGVLAMDAWRITQGQVPQRDFFELIPPVAAYVQAAVFYILGPTVLSLRLLGALYGVALLALVWVAGRLYLKNPLFISLPLALLIPFGVGVWPFASHHWLADIFLLAALPVLDKAFNAHFTTEAQRHGEVLVSGKTKKIASCVEPAAGAYEAADGGREGQAQTSAAFPTKVLPQNQQCSSVSPCLRGQFFAALGGALLAAAALTLQDQGGYALIGVFIATLTIEKASRPKVLAGLIAGAGVVGLLVVIPLAIKAGPTALVRDWVLFPLTQYRGVSGNRLTFAQSFAQILSQWDPQALRIAPVYATTIALASMFVYLLPFLCLGALLLAWRRKWLPPCSLALLAAMCLAFLLCGWHRWSLMNLIWAAPLPAIAFAIALERADASPKKWIAMLSKGFITALLVCLVTFGVLRIKAAGEKRRLHDIVTPAGSYRTFSPVEASELQGLVDAIAENVPPGAPLFCYGFDPLPSFLTGHPNPTRYNFVLPGGYTTQAQMENWKATLLSPNVSWGFGPNLPSEPPEPLETFLRAHYEPVWNNSAYTLWGRRANGR